MFKLGKKEQTAKKGVLEEIMGMMDNRSGSKLKDLKKPSAMEMSVTEIEPKDEDEGKEPMVGSDEESEGDEPSEDEKAKISELYHRYCK